MTTEDRARACERAATWFHHECDCGRDRLSYVTKTGIYGPMMKDHEAKQVESLIETQKMVRESHPFAYRVRVRPSAIVVALAERQEQKGRAQ